MVDFNNDTTVATPAIDVKRILILQDRQYLKEAIGVYVKARAQGLEADVSIIKSRLYELFLEIRAGVRRHLNPEEYDRLQELVISDEFAELSEAFDLLDTWLDNIGLTKVDVKLKLGGNLAERNKAQGWKA